MDKLLHVLCHHLWNKDLVCNHVNTNWINHYICNVTVYGTSIKYIIILILMDDLLSSILAYELNMYSC